MDEIDHIAIQVKDIHKAVNWYMKNFNCNIIYEDDTWAFLEFKNTKIALVVNQQHPPHFAILDDKINQDKNTVKHRDGSISKYIKDLYGNYIELLIYDDSN